MSQSSVVYFDQRTGAVHLRCWSISAFLSFLHQNDAQMMQMMQKCENVKMCVKGKELILTGTRLLWFLTSKQLIHRQFPVLN